jgi:hypothetical protein
MPNAEWPSMANGEWRMDVNGEWRNAGFGIQDSFSAFGIRHSALTGEQSEAWRASAAARRTP